MAEGLSTLFSTHDAAICVTHNEQAQDLAIKARNKIFGVRRGPSIYELPQGGAYIINRTEKEIFRYPESSRD